MFPRDLRPCSWRALIQTWVLLSCAEAAYFHFRHNYFVIFGSNMRQKQVDKVTLTLLCSRRLACVPSVVGVGLVPLHLGPTRARARAQCGYILDAGAPNIKDAARRRGFKQRGGILIRDFKACHLFQAKLAPRLPNPYFRLQLSFNQPMQMYPLPAYLSSISLLLCSHLCQAASNPS